MKKLKILMVCMGNICRSPLAEGILKDKISTLGLDWEIDSAGTGGWHAGEAPDPRSIEVAKKHNINIANQRARKITPADLEYYDLIVVMDSNNYQEVIALTTQEKLKNKVHLMMNFVLPVRNIQVPDPYWNDKGFEQVYEMLDRSCDGLIHKITDML